MKRLICLGFALFLSLPLWAAPNNTENASSPVTGATKPAVVPDSPEEKAYKAAMIKMSDAIAQKIREIQAKQKAIDSEVYLASKPALIADKVILEEQLRQLEMERDKMQTEKTAQDFTKQLKTPN